MAKLFWKEYLPAFKYKKKKDSPNFLDNYTNIAIVDHPLY